MNKSTVYIFNIAIALISVFAIVTSFISPLWSVKLKADITPEFAEAINSVIPEGSSSEESEEREFTESILNALADSNVSLATSFTMKSTDFLTVLFTQKADVTDDAVEKSVDDIMDGIDALISEVADATVKTSVKTIAKNQIRESVSAMMSNGENTDSTLDEIGITDSYIDEKAGAVLEAIKADGATTSSVTGSVMSMLDDIQAKILASGKFDIGSVVFTEEDRAKIEAAIAEFLKLFTDENGNIDFMAAFSEILTKIMDGTFSVDQLSSAKNTASVSKMLSASFAEAPLDSDSEKSSEDKSRELRDKIKEKLMGIMNDDMRRVLVVFSSVVAVILIISLVSWAYIVIKMLAKIGSPNPAIKLKAPIILGWLPFLNLVLLPAATLFAIKTLAMRLISENSSLTESAAKGLFGAIKLSFSSSGVFAAAAAGALIILSFFYMSFRKELERQ